MNDADKLAATIEKVVDDKISKAMRGGSSTVPAEYMGTDSEGKAWVVLAGADSATPVRRSSVEAARGDMVSVTVSDGMAVIDANLTDKSAGVASVSKADAKATVAQETAVEAIDYASQASSAASAAQTSADSATRSAAVAQASADSAVADAARANEAAAQAISDAADAATAASDAQTSADSAATAASSAKTSADKANYALSDVEKVVGTVNWIAEHGEYALTEDAAVDDSKVYYTRSGSGTEADPYAYAVVANPVDSELSTYYELHIDESVQNFINSHVWLEQDGLYVGTQGTDYKTRLDADSLDILDDSGNVVATFGKDGTQIGRDGESRVELNSNSMRLVDKDEMPYFRVSDLNDGDRLQVVTERWLAPAEVTQEGGMPKAKVNLSLDYAGFAHAVLWGTHEESINIETVADDPRALWLTFADGSGLEYGRPISITYATDEAPKELTFGNRAYSGDIGPYSAVLGKDCEASGIFGLAFGNGTIAASHNQAVLGKYNVRDEPDLYGDDYGEYAVIVGNGTSDSNRSNALTVDWNGNVVCNEVNGLALRSMGEIREASGSASVEKEANRNVADIRLPPGTWLVNARLQYPNNSTGRRAAKLSTTSEDGGNVISTDVRNAVSGALTQVQTERVFAITADDVEGEEDGKMPVYLVGWQNSGSTLTCSGNIQAVRLSPAIGESYDGGGGGGGGGASNYKELLNKPSIEGVTLVDDKTFPDLGLFIDAGEQYPQSDDYALTTLEINALWNNVMA